MFHKIKSVNALPNYKLSIKFSEGTTKIYDVSKLFKKYDLFLPLKNNELLFNSVTVEQGGYGIIWNDNIDISCNELWTNGEKITTPFDDLIFPKNL